ncbi:dTMP kinase [Streptomyces tsukubensis]|uniref:Thymidylate kinase n=1 Tax=Streptomyces tsukubensis TaxID=83656 RepID=A0A1V4AC77_9ACTN|nr:dTMP kinase [Streptomyces tsukubensis]OON81049.1 dTMP kinase [Streptomyces tsukubensis]QFR94890.1 dTMP kinase [Streptomyces tsukubensis]
MTRAEQPKAVKTAPDNALVADSRERAVRALLRFQPLKRLWSAQFTGGIGDSLALLVLVVLSLQAALSQGSFGGGYRGAAFAVATVLAVRVVATLLFGAVLLGPLASLTGPEGPLDRRWTMIGADGARVALLIVAPLWIDWTPGNALALLLVTGFVSGLAERLWTVCRESAAPALLPAPPIEGAAVRPLPDHMAALRRLSLRTNFLSLPLAALGLVVVTLVSNLLGAGLDWFHTHQAALASYVAAGLFAASLSVLAALELPDARTPRARSPLEGLRRPSTGTGVDNGRSGSVPVLVAACGAVAGAIASAVAVAVLHGSDLGGGPVSYGLFVLVLTGGTAIGIRTAHAVLPALSRRRLLAFAVAATGVALLAAGLVPDITTVTLLLLGAGFFAGIAANTGHVLLEQETEYYRQARTTEHLQAVARVCVALGAIVAPVVAAAIGRHRLVGGKFVFDHGGASFTLMLVGALLLPVAAVVLAKTDDRQGVPLRRDLREALRGGEPAQAPAATGFFIALEGGDGAGKSTQAEALATWIRAKGHEVVVTREPGATPVGKRLRSILLDVSSSGLSHRAEALLYAADRAEHVDTVVRPALERGAIVISDRYIDSSVAYQGAGRDLSSTEVARISRWATDGLVPHLTVLLDVSPEAARERFTEAPDRLESEPAEFHARVRSGFLTLAAADPGRYLVVDAGQEAESVTTVVRHRLDQLLPLSEAEVKAREEARKAAEEEARRKAEEEAARKAEEERKERERQEQIAKLRAEEEERKRQEIEEARRREEERKAEEARQREEEAKALAEQQRKREEAEQAAHEAEQARLRKQAEEEKRLRQEAEERRLEKQRKAEEALIRAEEARKLAAEQARVTQERAAAETRAREAREAEARQRQVRERETREREARERAEREHAEAKARSEVAYAAESSAPDRDGGSGDPADSETTLSTPMVKLPDETTVSTPMVKLPQDAAGDGGANGGARKDSHSDGPDGAADETTVLPAVPHEGSSDAEETAVLPQVTEDETAVLPRVQDDGAQGYRARARMRKEDSAADRIPPGYFRDERPGESRGQDAGTGDRGESPNERTRELPQVEEDGTPAAPARRRRSDWAEETPLDDLPTLADELLGPRDDEKRRGKGGKGGKGGRGGRGKG